MISTTGLSKAAVLAALYNGSQARGMGMFQSKPGEMTEEEARQIIGDREAPYFDYLYGRVLKVELVGDSFDERLYDRNLGTGAAQRAIDSALEEHDKRTIGAGAE